MIQKIANAHTCRRIQIGVVQFALNRNALHTPNPLAYLCIRVTHVYTFISSVCAWCLFVRAECKSRMRSRVTRELYICYVVVVCRPGRCDYSRYYAHTDFECVCVCRFLLLLCVLSFARQSNGHTFEEYSCKLLVLQFYLNSDVFCPWTHFQDIY